MNVAVLGTSGYPAALAGDHEAPAVLFHRGDPAALDGPRVAIVGTRRCSAYGRDVARQLGRELAAAGVAVVSGLALGIDGAAHEGVLAGGSAPPVGVVGSGLDVVYPRRHTQLWAQVGARGLLLGEAPPGARPEPWRFPARNRIVAALSHVVVVVESHAAGGSHHTVEAASVRGVAVMAVPGSVRSPASEGTNELLAAGAAPARDATDVLVALSLTPAAAAPRDAGSAPSPPVSHGEPIGPAAPADAAAAAVIEALGWEPATTEQIVARAALPLAAVALALARLEGDGLVSQRAGWWERRVPEASRARPGPSLRVD